MNYKLIFQGKIENPSQQVIVEVSADMMQVEDNLYVFHDFDETYNLNMPFAWYPTKHYSCEKITK